MIKQTYLSPHLVIDIGNTKIGGAVFAGDELIMKFRFRRSAHWTEELSRSLIHCGKLSGALVSSVFPAINPTVMQMLSSLKIPVTFVEDLKLTIDNHGHNVGSDRLADAYGVMKLHPGNAITIAVGTALVFNVIKGNAFYGGAICPGMGMGLRALAEHCALLPLVEITKPTVVCSNETEGNMRSGIYYGLLGTIERLIKELKHECFADSTACVVMTGGLFSGTQGESTILGTQLKRDLGNIVDHLEVDLTSIGLNEIYKKHL